MQPEGDTDQALSQIDANPTAGAAASAPAPSLLLTLDPDDLPALLRHKTLKVRRRPDRHSQVWHDTPDSVIAQAGLSLALCHEGAEPIWRLERMVADATGIHPPGALPLVLAEATTLDGLPPPVTQSLAARLLPVTAFEGQARPLATGDPAVTGLLLEGNLRAVTATRPVCRLVLTGAGAPALALELAARLRLGVAPDSLAAEATALAHRPVPQRPLGAPALPASLDVDDGFAFIVAHLAAVILHEAPRVGSGPEPVHQMRVGLRRLRSAILLFRRAVSCPALDDAADRLKALGRVLGPARDWDVFTQGTGRKVGQAFADDPAVQQLLAAAERKRRQGYTALHRYLDGAAFRLLGIALTGLALTRPWIDHTPDDPDQAAKRSALQRARLSDYAARALKRRLDPVLAPGPDLTGLDDAALHDIRLHAKRLRYAAEFFSPLFPGRETRRYLRRMSAVQERLGQLNDATVAAMLMAELPQGNARRAYAIGVVSGFVAAGSRGGRRKMQRSWHRFRKLEPFWH